MSSVRDDLQLAFGSSYAIERELGGGAMSRVFLAEDTRLGRRVVIKVLLPNLGAALSAERFEREIKLAARLQHPHIVPLLSAGDVNGLPYYTMPYVAGASLRERLRSGPVPPHEAQGLLLDVAKALAYAHRQGIVHRDIKPENVLISEGAAMIADYGVARALHAASRVADGGATLTEVGTQIGTPAYMAPEQAAGDPDVDFRADLYAFGVMAYEMFAGRHPFADRRTPHALVIAHMTEEPQALSARATNVNHPVTQIVMRCLGKAPADRPESASAIVAAFEGAATPVGTPVIAATLRAPTASIAVLPFANMSGDPENEYFSDGITDDIISALTQVRGLRVAARASSFSYKGKNEALDTIGRTLGVATVLQGSVRRAGNTVRVTAQLMSTHDRFQLWSARFDRGLDDIFAIQDEIARNIVERLELTLGLKDPKTLAARPTDDLVAYELYLRGREAVQQRTPVSMLRALDFFQRATARDAAFARAQLGLAEAYNGLGVYDVILPKEARARAEAAIATAASITPDLAALSLLRAQLKLYLRPDWPTAREDLADALRRDPDDALANVYVGVVSALLGERGTHTQAARRAVECDPLSAFIRGLAGMCHYLARDYEQALLFFEEGLAIDPGSVICHWNSGLTLDRLGRFEESLDRYQRSVDLSRRGTLMVALQQRALVRLGRLDEARTLAAELDRRSASEYIGAGVSLIPALVSGDESEMATALRRAIDGGTGPMGFAVSCDVELDALLRHPRLGPLVRQTSLYAQR